MKRQLFSYIVLFCALTAAGAHAQTFKKNATAGFVFLQLPVSARSAAMAEASIALSDLGSAGVFSNPATTGFQSATHSLSVSYAPWFAETKHYASSYSFSSPLGVISASAILLDYGTMTRTVRPTGSQQVYEVRGTFSASAVAAGLTFSRRLTEEFAFGLTAKYVREGIDAFSASNVVFDGGVLYYTGLGSLRLAASMQNFGTNAQYRNDPFKMPASLRMGLAAEVIDDEQLKVTTAVEALHPSDGDERINLGVEVGWQNLVFLRGGYKFLYDEETFSAGIGVATKGAVPVSADFALAHYGRLGNVIRFTLQMMVE